jgi:hypothetical protein
MTLVAVVGDDASTLTLALAAGWPTSQRLLAVEADPTGGSFAAWLDLPRSPGLAELVAQRDGCTAEGIDRAVQRSASGLEVLVAPVREVEAAAVVRAAILHVAPTLAVMDAVVALVDCGDLRDAVELARLAGTVVVAHRQDAASPAAAAVRLERLRDAVSSVRTDGQVVVAVRGRRPYPADEIAAFLGVPVVEIADDPYGAAVLAGRHSSVRRSQAAPLLRTARTAAQRLAADVVAAPGAEVPA